MRSSNRQPSSVANHLRPTLDDEACRDAFAAVGSERVPSKQPTRQHEALGLLAAGRSYAESGELRIRPTEGQPLRGRRPRAAARPPDDATGGRVTAKPSSRRSSP
jgi:hypothetical protein